MRKLLYLVTLFVCTPGMADDIDLYIISGQSNVFESRVEQTDNIDPDLAQVHSDIRYTYFDMFYGTETAWHTLRPRTLYSPSPGIGIGMEISFGVGINQASDNPVAIIKAWRGGADLDQDFNPQATSGLLAYSSMMTHINQRVSQLESQGHTVNLMGFAWIQGESDAADDPEQAERYGTNLANLISTLRADFSQPDMPFVYNRLNIGTDYEHEAAVRSGQEWVSQHISNVTMIDVDDVPLDSGLHHYGVSSKVELGYRFADAMIHFNHRRPGDLDADGFVGIDDLNLVLANWNQNVTPGDTLAGDATGDGYVGIDDLNTVLPKWNAGTPPSATPQNLAPNAPEPASLLILTSLLGLQFRRV